MAFVTAGLMNKQIAAEMQLAESPSSSTADVCGRWEQITPSSYDWRISWGFVKKMLIPLYQIWFRQFGVCQTRDCVRGCVPPSISHWRGQRAWQGMR